MSKGLNIFTTAWILLVLNIIFLFQPYTNPLPKLKDPFRIYQSSPVPDSFKNRVTSWNRR